MKQVGDDKRHQRAWLLLVATLAIHVADEALTGFLDFYNPLVRQIRTRWTWFPMPTFTFDVWLIGLIVLVILLTLLAPVIRQGGWVAAVFSWIFSSIMLLNGLGHLAGSVYFQQWLPGASSAPLLLAFSLLLMRRTWERQSLPHASAG